MEVVEEELVYLELPVSEVIIRVVCAMIVGGLIGADRERAHRGAGMRTDMIVCVASCAVMLVGQQVFAQYSQYGATPDPTRLAAQVVSGVGFLGAGTIIHEGVTVRGLTTAASLWAVAGLGIALGGGYYVVAFAAAAAIFLTLTVFNRLQSRVVKQYSNSYMYMVGCEKDTDFMKYLNTMAGEINATINGMHLTMKDNAYEMQFELSFLGGGDCTERNKEFFRKVIRMKGVTDIQCNGKFGENNQQ